jgi:hypothetical protein
MANHSPAVAAEADESPITRAYDSASNLNRHHTAEKGIMEKQIKKRHLS